MYTNAIPIPIRIAAGVHLIRDAGVRIRASSNGRLLRDISLDTYDICSTIHYYRCHRLLAEVTMPRKRETPRLLASELEILDALWQCGKATIVEVQRTLSGEPGYTTVQTRLNRMVKKGLVRRSRTTPSRYSAAITEEEVTVGDLDLLMSKVSRGRVLPLVAHLLKQHSVSQDELCELRKLIQNAEPTRREEENE